LAKDREELSLPSALHARLRLLEQAEEQMLRRFADPASARDDSGGGDRHAWLAPEPDRAD
jgi:hypothetical protein